MSPARIHTVCNDKFIGFKIVGDEFAKRRRQKAKLKTFLIKKPCVTLPELPSSHLLHGPVLKVGVARDEIEQLDAAVKATIDSKSNTVIFEIDPAHNGYKLLRLSK